MWKVRLGKNGRITLPKALREQLGWKPGTKLHFELQDGGIRVWSDDGITARLNKVYSGNDSGMDPDLMAMQLASVEREEW